MKSGNIIKFTMALLLTAGVAAGWAAQKDLKLDSKAEKEVTVVKEGKKETTLVPASKTLPGDVVRYTNHYNNSGTKPAENAFITNPVPKHTTYLDGTAFGEGATITFSIDKGKTFDTPGKLFKTDKGRKRNARAEEYTHIRWSFPTPIQPGRSGDVGFKVRIK